MDQATVHREQLLLLVDGIQRAKEASGGERSAELMRFLKITQAKINTLEKRIKIREKPFFLRSIAALCLLARGGYHNANGVKSMVRDVLG